MSKDYRFNKHDDLFDTEDESYTETTKSRGKRRRVETKSKGDYSQMRRMRQQSREIEVSLN